MNDFSLESLNKTLFIKSIEGYSKSSSSQATHQKSNSPLSKQQQPALKPTQDKYKSKEQYVRILKQLVKAEEKFEKQLAKDWVVEDAYIEWMSEGNLFYGQLWLSEDQKKEGNITLETRLKIQLDDWTASASIDSIEDEGLNIILDKGSKEPPTYDGHFTVKQVFNPVVYDRMTAGLKWFLHPSMSNTISSIVIGNPPSRSQRIQQNPIDTTLLSKFDLNPSQMKAATEALGDSPMYLILGPPGTGKTKTSVAIIAQLTHHITTQNLPDKILVCGPSNTAVDDLALKLHKAGVQGITRMYSATRENSNKTNPELRQITLSNKISEKSDKLEAIQKRIFQDEYLPDDEWNQYHKLKGDIEQEILKESRIVCCTCSASGDGRLNNLFFKNVFIDEAAQSIEPDTLIPMTFGAQRVLLAGDHKQLGPVIKCQAVKEAGLDRSMFERLINTVSHTMLDCQYRMHPLIAEFPSNIFYEGKLNTDSSVLERHNREAILSFKEKPLRFIDTNGREEKFGTSWINENEAFTVDKQLMKLIYCGVQPSDIGIITPYVGQKAMLQDYIHGERRLYDVKIASVDEFQGGEKGYIIISTVRTNAVGFLNDERRLNVAITRARHGIIICGNSYLLMREKNWRNLIEFYKANKSLKSQFKRGKIDNDYEVRVQQIESEEIAMEEAREEEKRKQEEQKLKAKLEEEVAKKIRQAAQKAGRRVQKTAIELEEEAAARKAIKAARKAERKAQQIALEDYVTGKTTTKVQRPAKKAESKAQKTVRQG